MRKTFVCCSADGAVRARDSAAQMSKNGKKIFHEKRLLSVPRVRRAGNHRGRAHRSAGAERPGLIRYIRKPGGQMPAFTEKVLRDQELTDIYAYLKTMPPPKPSKDIPLLNQMRN